MNEWMNAHLHVMVSCIKDLLIQDKKINKCFLRLQCILCKFTFCGDIGLFCTLIIFSWCSNTCINLSLKTSNNPRSKHFLLHLQQSCSGNLKLFDSQTVGCGSVSNTNRKNERQSNVLCYSKYMILLSQFLNSFVI